MLIDKKLRNFKNNPCISGCVGNIKKIGSIELSINTPGK